MNDGMFILISDISSYLFSNPTDLAFVPFFNACLLATTILKGVRTKLFTSFLFHVSSLLFTTTCLKDNTTDLVYTQLLLLHVPN